LNDLVSRGSASTKAMDATFHVSREASFLENSARSTAAWRMSHF
jgi:hypothetical protein